MWCSMPMMYAIHHWSIGWHVVEMWWESNSGITVCARNTLSTLFMGSCIHYYRKFVSPPVQRPLESSGVKKQRWQILWLSSPNHTPSWRWKHFSPLVFHPLRMHLRIGGDKKFHRRFEGRMSLQEKEIRNIWVDMCRVVTRKIIRFEGNCFDDTYELAQP